MIDLIDIGEAIKASRKSLGMTRERLAEISGMSRTRLQGLENGRIGDVGFTNLARVINAVGLDLRLTTANRNRPTLEDLADEDDEMENGDVARMGR